MNNYLCINSRKTELTEQQLRELGIAQADEYIPENEIAQMSRIALSGKAEEYYKVHDTITVGGTVFEIIGIGHDTDTITNKKIPSHSAALLPTSEPQCIKAVVPAVIRTPRSMPG